MTHTKTITLIACLVFLTFANSLVNSYIGDDFILFVGNDYYRNPKNIAQVFSPDFITTQEELSRPVSPGELINHSGCVAYRPVTALSYFLDFAIWKLNPHGMRFSNLLLHLINSILVYIVLFLMIRRKSVAGVAALLFGVHPIQVELVNNIGYRSDLLAVMFYCLTFIAFILQADGKKMRYWVWGFLTMALALFSKETAVTLPVMLMLYHIIFVNTTNIKLAFRKYSLLYALWWVLPIGYLCLYFFVFKNATFGIIEAAVPDRVYLFFYMLGHSWLSMFWPFNVNVVPTFYAPGYDLTAVWLLIFTAVFLVIGYYGTKLSWARRGVFSFLILWAVITYLPASNIFPLVNPMGYRYLYLPSIGVFAIVGMLTRWAVGFFETHRQYELYRVIVKTVMVVVCLMLTIRLNGNYKDNFAMHEAMRRSYPDSAYPNLILGTIYKEGQLYDKAIEHYRRYIENRPNTHLSSAVPGVHVAWHQIGTCYTTNHDAAIRAFLQAVEIKPDFAEGYASLGKAYLMKKNFPRALYFINEALKNEPGLYSAYVYLIQTYWEMGEADKAKAVLNDMLGVYPNSGHLKLLQKTIAP